MCRKRSFRKAGERGKCSGKRSFLKEGERGKCSGKRSFRNSGERAKCSLPIPGSVCHGKVKGERETLIKGDRIEKQKKP